MLVRRKYSIILYLNMYIYDVYTRAEAPSEVANRGKNDDDDDDDDE